MGLAPDNEVGGGYSLQIQCRRVDMAYAVLWGTASECRTS